MRQVGFIAAAGIHALDHHIERMETDHANARRLADGLAAVDGIDVDHNSVQTNMMFVTVPPDRVDDFAAYCARHRVLVRSRNPNRLVTHLDIDADGIDHAIDVMSEYFDA